MTLFIAATIVYAYFFQGTGWNQNAHFDTLRAIVERGTFEITEYAGNTGDVSRAGDRVYSNKPPGLPLLGAPAYWITCAIECALDVDPQSPGVVIANMHLTTIAVSAIPGALLIVAMYRLFRREAVSREQAVLLCVALALGSLIWPYAGVMMSHLAVAAGLIWTWVLVSDSSLTPTKLFVAGVLTAIAGVCDFFAAPLAGLFVAYLVLRRADPRNLLSYCAGPVLGAIVVALINYKSFDHLFATTYSYEDPYFKRPGMLFGQFHWPEFQRLYWITYHRMRGLFVCCPMFIVPIFSLVALRKESLMRINRIVPLLIVAYFVAFILTFLGWTGGWGVGPRYLIPALPFLWLSVRWCVARFRAISLLLIGLSIATMLSITAVQVLYPANDSGPPTHWDPVSFAWLGFVRGQLALSPDSYNVGMLLGLNGLTSVLPLLAIVGVFGLILQRYLSAARASTSAASAQRLYIAPDGCNPSAATSEANSRESGVMST